MKTFTYDTKASHAFIAGNGNIATDEFGVTYAVSSYTDDNDNVVWCVVEVEDGVVLASVSKEDLTPDLFASALNSLAA